MPRSHSLGDQVQLQGDDGTAVNGTVVELSAEGAVRVEWRSGPAVLRGLWGPSGRCAGVLLVGYQGARLRDVEGEE